MRVNASCEAAGLGSSRMNPARITSPWRSVHNSVRIPSHLQNDILGTGVILINIRIKGVTGDDKPAGKIN
jgi:hypothetical protein